MLINVLTTHKQYAGSFLFMRNANVIVTVVMVELDTLQGWSVEYFYNPAAGMLFSVEVHEGNVKYVLADAKQIDLSSLLPMRVNRATFFCSEVQLDYIALSFNQQKIIPLEIMEAIHKANTEVRLEARTK